MSILNDLLNNLSLIIAVISGVAVALFAVYLSRILSERMEMSSLRERDFRELLDSKERTAENLTKIVKEKDREIAELKAEVEEKDKKIAELNERIKFAEKVSDRDLQTLRNSVVHSSQTTDTVLVYLSALKETLNKLEAMEAERIMAEKRRAEKK